VDKFWWSIHSVPNLVAFEFEHGTESDRFAYNSRCIRTVRRRQKPMRGEHAGYYDWFVPVVSSRQTVAVLVAGPCALSRPTSVDILERWRRLSGRQGHPADPEFASYLAASLNTPVLEGKRAAAFEGLLVCLAGLMAGGPAAMRLRIERAPFASSSSRCDWSNERGTR
jgi:hypothetical protein